MNKENIIVKNKYLVLLLAVMLAICGIFAYLTISANAASGTHVTGYWWGYSHQNTKKYYKANVVWGYTGTEATSTKITIYSTRGSIYCNGGKQSGNNFTAGLRLYKSKVANEVKNNSKAAFSGTNLIKELKGGDATLNWSRSGVRNIYTTNKTYSYSKTKGSTSTVYLYVYGKKSLGVYLGGVKNYVASISVGDYPNRVVSFDANGGSGAPASVKQYWGDALDLSTLTAPTRTGYNFIGWAETASATESDVITSLPAQSSSIDAVTLYAVWKAKEYTITLSGDFPDGTTSRSVTVKFDSPQNNTLDPVEDIPLKYGYNFGSYSIGVQIEEGVSVLHKEVYDATGNYIVGTFWDDAGNWIYDGDSKLAAGASWRPKRVTATFDAAGGAFSDSSTTYSATMRFDFTPNNDMSSNLPMRTGYTFKGFYHNSIQVYDENGNYVETPSGSTLYWNSGGEWQYADTDALTLTAKWEANAYTIIFDKTGGSGGTDSVSATYNSTLPTLSSLPTKEGCVFAGYYDAVTGGKQYYDGNGEGVTTWDKTENTTLYARWSVTDLPVTYNKNTTDSVTNMPESQIAQTGKSFTFSALVPKRTSPWVFKGWCESADGTGTLYSPGQTIKYGKTEGITFYAVWGKDSKKRHFKIMFSL